MDSPRKRQDFCAFIKRGDSGSTYRFQTLDALAKHEGVAVGALESVARVALKQHFPDEIPYLQMPSGETRFLYFLRNDWDLSMAFDLVKALEATPVKGSWKERPYEPAAEGAAYIARLFGMTFSTKPSPERSRLASGLRLITPDEQVLEMFFSPPDSEASALPSEGKERPEFSVPPEGAKFTAPRPLFS